MGVNRTGGVLWGLVTAFFAAVVVGSALSAPTLLTGAFLAVLVALLIPATAWTVRRLTRDGALQSARPTMETIVSIAADAIISVDADQRIVLFNEGAERIFRYDAEEVLGKPLDILLPERNRSIHARHIQEFGETAARARRMGERTEIAGLRANGEEFPAEASISKMHVEGERYFTVVLRDITARKRAEERERFLARVTETLSSSLDYEKTLERLADLAVPELADWCVIYMIENDAVHRLHTAHRDPDRADLLAELRRYALDRSRPHPVFPVLETGETDLIEEFPPSLTRSIAQDEEHLRILKELGIGSVIIAPLVARGETFGAMAFVTEPGGRRFWPEDRALVDELARRAAQAVDNARLYRQARSAVAARDEVMSIVSHDLGNPLSAIFVGTRLLIRRLDRLDDAADAVRQVEDIRRAAAQMERLIDDLLEMHRIEAGRLEIQTEPREVGALMREACRAIQPLAEEKEITLRCESDGLGDLRALADEDRIMQVFSNLVGNAIKFTPEGGNVTVSARPDGDRVTLSVRDTGPGIAPEDLPYVFDRFWQARKGGRHGVGLGLSIARAIVEAHGGEIHVESREGAGSTFRFTLPRAHAGDGGGDGGAAA